MLSGRSRPHRIDAAFDGVAHLLLDKRSFRRLCLRLQSKGRGGLEPLQFAHLMRG
jgi:hypothetical protein